MQEIDELIASLEILSDAIAASDQPKSFEAVTVVLVQFMDVWGHDEKMVTSVFPLLEDLREQIQAEDYELASVHVREFLAKFRSVQARMRSRGL